MARWDYEEICPCVPPRSRGKPIGRDTRPDIPVACSNAGAVWLAAERRRYSFVHCCARALEAKTRRAGISQRAGCSLFGRVFRASNELNQAIDLALAILEPVCR